MSKTMKGAVMFTILIVFVVLMLTVRGRSVRSTENTNALTEAVESSLQSVMEQRAYSIEDSSEFTADFLETLLVQYETDSDITVRILGMDMEKGLLSVEVDEQYMHPNGRAGHVNVQRTVIFDKKAEELPVFHSINFWNNGELYKSYTLQDGEHLIEPKKPDGAFTGWINTEEHTQAVITSLTADKDYNFEAEFTE